TIPSSHVSAQPIPAKFHLEPGSYSLKVAFVAGPDVTRNLAVRAGEVVVVDLSCSEPAAPVKPAAPAEPRRLPRAKDAAGRASKPHPNSSAWPWIAFGG